MKISIDVQPFVSGNLSGIGYYTLNIVKELQKRDDCELFLEYFSMRNISEKERSLKELPHSEKNTKISCCKYFTNRFYILLTAILPVPRRLFFKTKPDVSFFTNFFLPPFARGKKVLVIHDMAVKDHTETLDRKNLLILKTHLSRSVKRADLIVTISEYSKQRIAHYFPAAKDKIVVIPCGIDHEKFKPCEDFSRIAKVKDKFKINGDYLLYLGTLEPRKNIERLIEAYSLFQKKAENPPLLVIAGAKGWLYDSIFEKANALGLSERVIFTGRVSDEDVVPLISGAKLFCFPSLYEGFGLPVLEAMACGTPVLTANNSSLPEVGGDACVYCDAENVQSIAKAMETVISDEKLCALMAEKGIRRALGFSWEECVNKLCTEFKNQINGG